jgi:hypothetical protein
MTWASAYFRHDEFDSEDAPGSGISMDANLIHILDQMRERCGFPFIITSGYRTANRNAVVGGSPRSAHLRGKAADISATEDRKRFAVVKAAFEFGIRRLEVGRTWVHVDIDESLPQDVIFLP